MEIDLPRYIAHRGAMQVAPENTLLAMAEALRLGASWIECDVRLSSDNKAVIIHDRSLKRTTNAKGRVDQTSFAQLRTLSASPDCNPEVLIPSLEEMLQFVHDNNLGLNLEVKVPFKNMHIFCAELMRIMKQVPVCHEKFLISLSCRKSLSFMQRKITAKYGLVIPRWPLAWRKKLLNHGLYSVHFNHRALSAKRVAKLNAAGLKVLAYTVNNKNLATKLFSWGVVSIFTDCLF